MINSRLVLMEPVRGELLKLIFKPHQELSVNYFYTCPYRISQRVKFEGK